jgi:hypothetical protein
VLLYFYGWADPAKKKKSGPGLGFQPGPIVVPKGVFGKTHPYAMTIIFMPILV